MDAAGIYIILCLPNNKVYVGATKTLKHRLIDHKSWLRNNKHPNKGLQEDYTKFGVDNFEFKIIQYCYESEIDDYEHYYFGLFDCLDPDKGYNVWGAGKKGRKMSAKMLKEMTERLKGVKPSPLSWVKSAEVIRKKVINTRTGEIFNSITEAAKLNNINEGTLSGWLNGRGINNSGLTFYKA